MNIYNNVIKKKTIPLVLSLALSSGILVAGCSSQAATTATEIPVGENQRLVQGQILVIAGNEITLAVLDVTQLASSANTEAQESKSGSTDDPAIKAEESGDTMRPNRPAGGDRGRDSGATPVETLQLSIPVGTDIVTVQGKTTTFSRLAASDTVQVLLEQSDDGEVVVGVWMVEIMGTEQTSDATAND